MPGRQNEEERDKNRVRRGEKEKEKKVVAGTPAVTKHTMPHEVRQEEQTVCPACLSHVSGQRHAHASCLPTCPVWW